MVIIFVLKKLSALETVYFNSPPYLPTLERTMALQQTTDEKKKTHFAYRFTRNRLLSIFSRYIVQLTITICIICKLKSQGSLGRGTQRRFPSKYVENTFQAIQSSFRSQEKHSRRRYKIGSCSVTLGDFASFTCRNYRGFRIIFPKMLDAIYPFKKVKIFLIPLSITFLNPKVLGLVFLRKTAEKQHY